MKGATAPMPMRARVAVRDDGAVRLSTQITVNRKKWGVTGNMLGMVGDKTTLSTSLVSGTPQDSRSICPRVRGRSGARGGHAGSARRHRGRGRSGDREGGVVYGVTVTRPDGTAVEVRLDKDFHVLDTQPAGHYHDNDSDDE